MKKRIKITAIVLSAVLGVGVLTSAGLGVYNLSNRIKGTEAAKILLARDNMSNGEQAFDWNEIVSNSSSKTASPQTFSRPARNTPIAKTQLFNSSSYSQSASLGNLVHDSPAGKVYQNDGEYIFKNISGASHQGLVVESRLFDIDYRVENAAKNINYLKNELNIVNKWVKDGYSKFYLDVNDNRERLLEYYEDSHGLKSLWVVERETRPDSNSVYSLMYTDMEKGIVDNPTFLVYIPNERYEYYYGHDGNTTDYLIAEQDKGYWNIFMPDETSFRNVIIKDGFAYQSSGNYTSGTGNHGTVSTTSLKEDIISNYSNGVVIHLSAFNGINGIHAPENTAYVETYEGGEKSYVNVNHSEFNKLKVKLSNGNFLSEGNQFTYGGKTVTVDDMYLEFFTNPGFADPQYDVSFALDMGEGLSLNEKLNLLEEFLSDNDLTCKYDINSIENNIIKNSEVSNTITSFYEWNGYLVNSSENFKKAESVIFTKINDMFSEYENAKNAETVDKFWSGKVAKRQDFGSVSDLSLDSAVYDNGKVTINNLSLVANKTNLMESGKQYKLQVGLSRIDSDGNLLNQNTVNLATSATVNGATYNGADLALTVTGEYDIPTVLEEGKYVVVVYVVTADEGIRVSKMQAIAFVDTVNQTIETSLIKINVKNDNNTLIVEYASKVYFNLTLNGEVTYETLRKKMMAEVLKHGYPSDDEDILDANDNAVTDGTIIQGEYKLKFTVSTIDGPITAYVVCTVE